MVGDVRVIHGRMVCDRTGIWYGGSVQPVGTLRSTLQVSTTVYNFVSEQRRIVQVAGWDSMDWYAAG